MAFYTLTIFLSAFLLFEVQPIIAKMILPWFGGTSAVWSTCMLFFQVVLLLGYLYAHVLHRRFSPRGQAILHSGVLALSLVSLPILPDLSWKSADVGQPSFRILTLLAATVGLPYFLLSSTSPLLQAWYARQHKSGLAIPAVRTFQSGLDARPDQLSPVNRAQSAEPRAGLDLVRRLRLFRGGMRADRL